MTGAARDKTLTRIVHRILFGLIVLVSLMLLVLWRIDSPRLERVRMHLIDAMAPVMIWVSEPIDFARNLSRDYRAHIDVHNRNRQLRGEIQTLRTWRERANLLEEENAQLRALNSIRLEPHITFVTGQVFANSSGQFLQSVLVNVGRRDGVTNGSIAVNEHGVVGRVTGTGERAVRLLLLTDFTSRVPVIIQPGGLRGVLTGDGTAMPKIEFIHGNVNIRPGDLIKTSGDGGVFPPNLSVGRVVAARSNTWRAALLADYARLRFVRVLRYTPKFVIDDPGDLIARPAAPAGQQSAGNGPHGRVAAEDDGR